MIITVPADLTFQHGRKFCKFLDQVEETDRYTFDFHSLSTVEPFGMLLVGAKIRQFMNRFPTAEYFDINFKHHTYAANMGFFKSIYQEYGKDPGELPGNSNYIPITKIDISKLHKESRSKREHVVDTVERESALLAHVLAKKNRQLQEILTYAIREILRNTVEHSESDYIWFAGQYWPTKDRVEIAILDEGIGIKKSLKSNPRLKIKSDEDALFLAVEPGITRKRPTRFDQDDPYANTGFGLFLTSRICQSGGDFVLCSGSKILALTRRKNYLSDTSFNGTAIRMRLIVTKQTKLTEVLPGLIKEGERIAKKNRKRAILSASKVSSLLLKDGI